MGSVDLRDGGAASSFLRRVALKYVTSTEQIGRAMLSVAKRGYPTRILETEDINRVVV